MPQRCRLPSAGCEECGIVMDGAAPVECFECDQDGCDTSVCLACAGDDIEEWRCPRHDHDVPC